jgi:hypothetical protein
MREIKVRRMPAFGKADTYEVLVLDRKGKGWVSVAIKDGRPARFSAPPANYNEAMKIIANQEDMIS